MRRFSRPWLRRRWKRLAGLGVTLGVITWLCMSSWPLSLSLLRLYPKRAGSAAAGWAAGRSLPGPLRRAVLTRFVRAYGVDMAEAELPLEAYPSLQALFTRRLKPGLRPQELLVPGAVNSPVDGRIIACGRIEAGHAIQAKGLPYALQDLLKHDPMAMRFEGGHYLTLYLSPRDYHRIHVPFQGKVTSVGRVEGELWPVNDASTAHVPRLYARNRRATWVATGTGPDEGLEVAAVAVGATHVGGVLLDPRWLGGRELPRDGAFGVDDLPCRAGDDLGTFQFGSTVVLLIGGPGAGRWRPLLTEGPVQVGQRLGSYP
ncbi:archaetidylserine decarboxylase [Mesoterricola sediminis]|uniref:phosphatidylserine decarboxylase n=1 Tax=Mesoterricola sediminis TaxID=2927980 RepID=A0AA48H6U1_9BACT|nr:archaetidylserine decarboxylase [Mesoterricola sediminis]BDU78436.1 phosphatidylserine decarboxylase proenzyme [Mesoterricola sediminis]